MASVNCVKCSDPVRPRQEGLICDGCQLWQHRKCDSGISQQQYRGFNRNGTAFDWKCFKCSVPSMEVMDVPTSEAMEDMDVPTSEPMEDMDVPTNGPMDVEDSFTVETPYDVPIPAMESSISDDADVSVFCDEEPIVVYTQVEAGTSRGKPKLFDNQGFSYTIKSEKKTTIWRCSKRSGPTRCPATVIQDGETYQQGLKNHLHAAEPGIHTATKIKVTAKHEAKGNVFAKSCSSIAERVLSSVGSTEEPIHSRPSMAALVKSLQRTRQTLRPNDPTDVSSRLEEDFIDHSAPGFYQKRVKVGEKRHHIFYSERQMQLLARAKTWYMDATFRVVNKPWSQLFSIHAFIKTGETTRLFPIEQWCVFMLPVRTNNDVEGWHNRLNSRVNARGPVPFYLLICELYIEASKIQLDIIMMSEGSLRRHQRKKYKNVEGKLFSMWERYNDGEISTSRLLKKIACIYGPPAS